jgi:hypothetical protein
MFLLRQTKKGKKEGKKRKGKKKKRRRKWGKRKKKKRRKKETHSLPFKNHKNTSPPLNIKQQH